MQLHTTIEQTRTADRQANERYRAKIIISRKEEETTERQQPKKSLVYTAAAVSTVSLAAFIHSFVRPPAQLTTTPRPERQTKPRNANFIAHPIKLPWSGKHHIDHGSVKRKASYDLRVIVVGKVSLLSLCVYIYGSLCIRITSYEVVIASE